MIVGRSVGLDLTLDDFQKVSDQVPLLADLKPSGKYVMEDIHKVWILFSSHCLSYKMLPLATLGQLQYVLVQYCYHRVLISIRTFVLIDWRNTCSHSLSVGAPTFRWRLYNRYILANTTMGFADYFSDFH